MVAAGHAGVCPEAHEMGEGGVATWRLSQLGGSAGHLVLGPSREASVRTWVGANPAGVTLLPAQRQTAPPQWGSAVGVAGCAERPILGCAHCAHFGRRIGSYWGRIGPDWRCFREFPLFARDGVRFESHLGHVFSLFRGLWASECAQAVHLWAPSGPFLVVAVVVAGVLLACLADGFDACYLFIVACGVGCMTWPGGGSPLYVVIASPS